MGDLMNIDKLVNILNKRQKKEFNCRIKQKILGKIILLILRKINNIKFCEGRWNNARIKENRIFSNYYDCTFTCSKYL